MRFFVRVAAAVTTTVFVATLVGCTPDEGPPAATTAGTQPTTTSAVFKTEAEALNAARKTYDGYNRTTDAIARDGGTDPNRVAKWVTAGWLDVELTDAAAMRKSGERITGQSSYFRFELQRVLNTQDGVEVGAYVCVDISDTRLVNKSGKDITPQDRGDVYALELQFVSAKPPTTLLLERSAPWTDPSRCV